MVRDGQRKAQSTWYVAENGQQDVDEEVDPAASLQEDTDRRENDGEDDLDDVRAGYRHGSDGSAVDTQSPAQFDL